MTKKMRFLFLFLLIMSTLNAQSSQQPVSGYVEGVIYLKIANSSNVLISYPPPPNVAEDSLYEALEKYGTTQVVRPFTLFDTPIFDRCYKIFFTDTSDVLDFINILSSISYVEFAEQVPKMSLFATIPNDPEVPAGSWQLGAINAYDAFDLHQGGSAVVAVVDNAVLTSHEDLAANIVAGWDVADGDNDPNPPLTGINAATPNIFSHGTHVSGIAGAVTDNGIGIASIGWNNSLMPIKATEDQITVENLLSVTHGYEGVAWAAVNNADVINLSWGGTEYSLIDRKSVV